MGYEEPDQGNDTFGMISTGRAGGQGTMNGDLASSVKGGLRAGMSISIGAAAIAKGVGTASAVAGPIGAAASFAVETCITFYEASQDLGKSSQKIAALETLKTTYVSRKDTNDEPYKILLWLINKLGRRAAYAHAETGGTHVMASGIKDAWTNGSKGGAVAGAIGMAVATPVTTIAGQFGANATRFGRGFAKMTGMMGSQRKDFAKKLMDKKTDPLAAAIIKIVLMEGLANTAAATDMQKEMDKMVLKAVEQGMSSFKA